MNDFSWLQPVPPCQSMPARTKGRQKPRAVLDGAFRGRANGFHARPEAGAIPCSVHLLQTEPALKARLLKIETSPRGAQAQTEARRGYARPQAGLGMQHVN